MMRQETIRVVRAAPLASDSQSEFEPCTVAHWAELVGIICMGAFFGALLFLASLDAPSQRTEPTVSSEGAAR